MHRVRILAAGILLMLAPAYGATIHAQDGGTTPVQSALQGQAAVEYLKQQGLYDSLTARDGIPGDEFGVSVAISGKTVVVGARLDTETEKGLSRSGSAYIFVRSDDGKAWIQHKKLTADPEHANALFGTSVAISGRTIVVGAPGDDGGMGAAYIFKRIGDEWTQQKPKLTPRLRVEKEGFGGSVAISGKTVVVGAEGDPNEPSTRGSVYIFTRMGPRWKQQQLTAADAGEPNAVGTWFGHQVAISGKTVVVGAPLDRNGRQGSAYIFDSSGGFKQKLMPSVEVENGFFGQSVAIDGERIVVGAQRDEDKVDYSGSAYIFDFDSIREMWTQNPQRLTHSPKVVDDLFGTSVAISGDTVVVGAPGNYGAEPLPGAAYIFEFNGVWTPQTQKLTPSPRVENDLFGGAVALSGDTVVVGAPGDSRLNPGNVATTPGAAYIFEPDLVPRTLLCSPRLVLRVDNRGAVDAGPSITHVEVLATVPIPRDVHTPAIPAGGFVSIDAGKLPAFCRTGCTLNITADVNNNVAESDETNNVVNERCPR